MMEEILKFNDNYTTVKNSGNDGTGKYSNQCMWICIIQYLYFAKNINIDIETLRKKAELNDGPCKIEFDDEKRSDIIALQRISALYGITVVIYSNKFSNEYVPQTYNQNGIIEVYKPNRYHKNIAHIMHYGAHFELLVNGFRMEPLLINYYQFNVNVNVYAIQYAIENNDICRSDLQFAKHLSRTSPFEIVQIENVNDESQISPFEMLQIVNVADESQISEAIRQSNINNNHTIRNVEPINFTRLTITDRFTELEKYENDYINAVHEKNHVQLMAIEYSNFFLNVFLQQKQSNQSGKRSTNQESIAARCVEKLKSISLVYSLSDATQIERLDEVINFFDTQIAKLKTQIQSLFNEIKSLKLIIIETEFEL